MSQGFAFGWGGRGGATPALEFPEKLNTFALLTPKLACFWKLGGGCAVNVLVVLIGACNAPTKSGDDTCKKKKNQRMLLVSQEVFIIDFYYQNVCICNMYAFYDYVDGSG